MAIDPIGSGPGGRTKPETVASGDGPVPGRSDARRKAPKPGVRATGTSDTQITGQMLEIGRRIARNYYDRPEILRIILEKLKREK